MKIQTLYNLIGPQVRRFRCEQKWSQEDLADRLHEMGWDICRQRIARIEGGNTWVSDIEHYLLAKVFGKKMEDLLPHMDSSESIFIVLSQLTGKLKMVMSPDEILEKRSKKLLNGHEFCPETGTKTDPPNTKLAA
jgi:hypothetical protein